MMPDRLPPPPRRSIPPVAPEDAALAGRLLAVQFACEEIATYLPVRRVDWDRLAEFADMLEAITPDIRRLVERKVVNGRAEVSRDLPTHPPTSPDIQ